MATPCSEFDTKTPSLTLSQHLDRLIWSLDYDETINGGGCLSNDFFPSLSLQREAFPGEAKTSHSSRHRRKEPQLRDLTEGSSRERERASGGQLLSTATVALIHSL